ncbi:hypothetical protein Dsin_010329 [Dipteronia sinensis]|uniref:Uncharacterized protein n=1 Tax=Dipteronia sinensis TaxID=43782 RepID=A0AAE0ATM0_9ROSI|nr:hypothetical protein Dsin_010329 [Dipteronia sinensis]
MTISLSELQMILSTVSSFSWISGKEVTSEMTHRHWSVNQGSDNSLTAIIPDGAIVAIQDVNQHTYFTVEGKERKYTLVGAIHYSLVEKGHFSGSSTINRGDGSHQFCGSL